MFRRLWWRMLLWVRPPFECSGIVVGGRSLQVPGYGLLDVYVVRANDQTLRVFTEPELESDDAEV